VPSRDGEQLTREEAQTVFARLLLERVRQDNYPSMTQLTILEQTLPPSLEREYLDVLLEKAMSGRVPNVTLLKRIQQITDRLR
jgi:hypothetical protein